MLILPASPQIAPYHAGRGGVSELCCSGCDTDLANHAVQCAPVCSSLFAAAFGSRDCRPTLPALWPPPRCHGWFGQRRWRRRGSVARVEARRAGVGAFHGSCRKLGECGGSLCGCHRRAPSPSTCSSCPRANHVLVHVRVHTPQPLWPKSAPMLLECLAQPEEGIPRLLFARARQPGASVIVLHPQPCFRAVRALRGFSRSVGDRGPRVACAAFEDAKPCSGIDMS